MKDFFSHMLKVVAIIVVFVQLSTIVTRANNMEGYSFHRITYEDKLPFYKYCYAVCHDTNGFMWFGSELGLHRFDGNTFTSFIHDPSNIASIKKGEVKTIAQLGNSQLLIGTSTGVDIFNTQDNSFLHVDMFDETGKNLIVQSVQGFVISDINEVYLHTHFSFYKYHPNRNCFIRIPVGTEFIEGSNFVIESVISVAEYFVWGSDKGGLFVNSTTGNAFREIDLSSFGKNGVNGVNKVFRSVSGKIWIATGNGLFVANSIDDLINGGVRSLKVVKAAEGFLVNGLCEDKSGLIWASTDGDGLVSINPNSLDIVQFKERSNVLGSLLSNKAQWVYVDAFNNLWAFFNNYGFNVVNLDNESFHFSIKSSHGSESGLSGNVVTSFAQDRLGRVWVGTDGQGLNCYDPVSNRYVHYRKIEDKGEGLKSDDILDLFVDSDNNLWIGTYQGGVSMLNIETGRIKTFMHDALDSTSICGNNISSIAEDNQGNIYLLTISNGLSIYDKQKQEFTHINAKGSPVFRLSHNGGKSLMRDSDGNIWVGAYFGLNQINAVTKEVKQYISLKSNNNTLTYGRIDCIFQDSRGRIWIGTNDGLDLYDKKLDEIRRVYSRTYFGNVAINSIVEDKFENLWFGTDNGLVKVHMDEIGRDSATYGHFLSEQVFLNQAAFKAKNGDLYFGSSNGYTYLNPSKVPKVNTLPKIVITELHVHDRLLKPGDAINNHQLLQKNIESTEVVTISHLENNFAFVFSALDYSKKDELVYLYKLEGFDNEWRVANNTHRSAIYTNLDKGTYRFKVKLRSGYDKIESAEVGIDVVILPPWWKSWWAIALYLLASAGVILAFVKSVTQNANLQRHLYFERIALQKEVDVAQIKQDFFTNVTHEFRTPLTLIIGPLENLIAKYRKDKFLAGQLEVIYRNSSRLLRLINELLEIRKIEETGGELNLSKEDISDFVRKILDGFSIALQSRNIEFELVTNIDHLDVCFDKEKLEKVIFNLLSNALKHTPEGGAIRCEVNTVGNGSVSLKVIDSGKGIDPELLSKVFDKFYSKGHEAGYSGIGIGLHLAKRIVSMHNGTLSVQNNPDKGACFEVVIPIQNENYKGVSAQIDMGMGAYDYKTIFGKTTLEEAAGDGETKEPNGITILVVEDNDDVRSYLGSFLSEQFDVRYAANGEEGLEIAFEIIPDLIITDVMMPKLDGKSLCQAIKKDVRTSHIPIIMITALADVESRIEGLDVGADSYMVKPFHPKHMMVRIKHLMDLRKVLMGKSSNDAVKTAQSFEYKAQDVDKLSVDEVFLNKLVAFIEKNLSNAELEVEDICKELGMNYLQLYRKVKAITDMSIKQFILTIRMRNAAKLLESGKFTISEVAFDVGFSSPAYFSKIFRRFFDKTATEYLQDKEREEGVSDTL